MAEDIATAGKEGWDSAFARRLIGKTALIGITVLDKSNNAVSRSQYYGKIDSADAREGISMTLAGSKAGERLRLPPSLSPFTRAAPGVYNLRGSTDKVTNPDYTALWEFYQPEKK